MRIVFIAMTAAMLAVACSSVPQSPSVLKLETDDLNDVAQAATDLANRYGPEFVLVAFDLDDTLLTAAQPLGSDAWYEWQASLSDDQPCSPDRVVDLFPVQGALMHEGAMTPVQPGAAQLVDQLQQAGHPVNVVTSRGTNYYLQTFRELRRNQLFFNNLNPKTKINRMPYQRRPDHRPIRYADGVYMLAGQHKGDYLLDLLIRQNFAPKAVVFADDGERHVKAMVEALTRAGIAGQAFLYTGAYPKKAEFDPLVAAQSWRAMRPHLMQVQQAMGSRHMDLDSPPPVAAGCSTDQNKK